jgi:hypothetical protein
MRGSKALFTTDEVQKKIAENVCNMEAAYSCIFNHPDDTMCITNKLVFIDCMKSMLKSTTKTENNKPKNNNSN